MSFVSPIHAIRILNYKLFKKLAKCYVHDDLKTSINETDLIAKARENQQHGIEEQQKWHFFHNLDYACRLYNSLIQHYLTEFK